MAKKLEIPAFKLNQPTSKEQGLFIASLKVNLLIDKSYFQVNWWKKEKMGSGKEQGYQRIPNENRIKKVASYFETFEIPIFPTNLVVASHTPLIFTPEKNSDNLGLLTIGTTDTYPLWIIDGQTRIEGFKYSIDTLNNKEIGDYEMPVTFLSGFKLIQELEQFFILNSTQKKVQTDLSQRLRLELIRELGAKKYEAVGLGKKWEMESVVLADLLNHKNEEDNIWYFRIKLPNTEKAPSNMISQNSFITSLKPLFRGGAFEYYIRKQEDRYDAIKIFWNAISEFFRDAFVNYHDYVILRTTGVFSLHDLANTILMLLISEKLVINKSNILDKLNIAFNKKESEFTSDFWRRDNITGATQYGSMKGFKLLADRFKLNLPEPQIKTK